MNEEDEASRDVSNTECNAISNFFQQCSTENDDDDMEDEEEKKVENNGITSKLTDLSFKVTIDTSDLMKVKSAFKVKAVSKAKKIEEL